MEFRLFTTTSCQSECKILYYEPLVSEYRSILFLLKETAIEIELLWSDRILYDVDYVRKQCIWPYKVLSPLKQFKMFLIIY